jgi:small GTP-binding protein
MDYIEPMPMKVVLVGDTQVGKTCIVTRLVSGTFRPSMPATIGAAFQTHSLSTPQGITTLQIWDTAGQERYRALAPMYYRSAEVAILVYDVTSTESFEGMQQWVTELSEKAPSFLKVAIVGNKIDLTDDRTVAQGMGKAFAEQHGVKVYAEVSAKTGDGIVNLFTNVALLGAPSLVPATPTLSSSQGDESRGCCKGGQTRGSRSTDH